MTQIFRLWMKISGFSQREPEALFKISLHLAFFFTEKTAMLAFGHYNHPTTKIQSLVGNLNGEYNLGLEEIISEAGNGKCDHLILNVSAITGMDLGGVGQLFTWYFNLKANQVRLSIVSPPSFVRDALEAAHLTELIPIYRSVPDAMMSVLPAPASPR